MGVQKESNAQFSNWEVGREQGKRILAKGENRRLSVYSEGGLGIPCPFDSEEGASVVRRTGA